MLKAEPFVYIQRLNKMVHLTFDCNFGKYKLISKILLLLDS